MFNNSFETRSKPSPSFETRSQSGFFKWDGSDVTDLIKDKVIEQGRYGKIIYWKIYDENNDKFEICMMRTATYGTIPCLIDELKPIFQLEKVGMHYFSRSKLATSPSKKSTKYCILLKVLLNEKGQIIHDLPLESYYHQKITYEIQKIFLFRELLGITKSYEKSIVLRITETKNRYVVPISFYESNMEPCKNTKIVSDKIIEKWFSDIAFDVFVKQFFKVKTIEDIPNTIYAFRNKLSEVVTRYDSEYITFVTEIVSRLTSRLVCACV